MVSNILPIEGVKSGSSSSLESSYYLRKAVFDFSTGYWLLQLNTIGLESIAICLSTILLVQPKAHTIDPPLPEIVLHIMSLPYGR